MVMGLMSQKNVNTVMCQKGGTLPFTVKGNIAAVSIYKIGWGGGGGEPTGGSPSTGPPDVPVKIP